MRPLLSASIFSAQGAMKNAGTDPCGGKKCWQRSVTSCAAAAPAVMANAATPANADFKRKVITVLP